MLHSPNGRSLKKIIFSFIEHGLLNITFGSDIYLSDFSYQNLLILDFIHENQMKQSDRHVRSIYDVQRTRLIHSFIFALIDCITTQQQQTKNSKLSVVCKSNH